MRRGLVLYVIVPFVLIGTGCGSDSDDPAAVGDAGEHAVAPAEEIGFGSSLAQIRGHHLVALELYDDGDQAGALVHAGHPIDEILTSVTSELEEHEAGAADELAAALESVRDLVENNGSLQEVRQVVDGAATATHEAEAVVVGDAAGSSEHIGSVIADLLATAAHEYEEAVAGSGAEVKLLAEYQDGYGFVTEGRQLYDQIESDVTASSQEEADEIAEAFEALNDALPSPQPPTRLSSVLDVESAAELIAHELEETVGAQLLEEADPEEIAEKINKLLDEIVTAYEAGDADAAAELAAEAYLDNYEVIEAEVIENAPHVNDELEPLLGAELRRRIQEGAPAGEIKDMVARVRELLDDALEALEEH